MDLDQARRVIADHFTQSLKRHGCFDSPPVVREYLSARCAGLEHEVFFVLFLDAQHRLIEAVEMFRGSLTQTSVYPREIVKEALRHNAAAVDLPERYFIYQYWHGHCRSNRCSKCTVPDRQTDVCHTEGRRNRGFP